MANYRLSAAVRRGAIVFVAVVTAALCAAGMVAPTTAYADTASSSDRVHNRNLLRAHSFTDHGYARVTTYDNWEGEGAFELSGCDGVPSYQAPGKVNRRFRMYVGRQTDGQQVVIQFANREAASTYVEDYQATIDGCGTRTHGTIRFSRTHRPSTKGATQAYWWSTSTDEGGTRSWGTVSLVRVGDRVSVLTMSSVTSQPRQIMDVPALMQDMVARLDLD